MITGLAGYRFTGSSLLIIYDGASSIGAFNSAGCVDTKMVDFAKSTLPGFLDDTPLLGPDEGYLFGLNSLILIINEILSTL